MPGISELQRLLPAETQQLLLLVGAVSAAFIVRRTSRRVLNAVAVAAAHCQC